MAMGNGPFAVAAKLPPQPMNTEEQCHRLEEAKAFLWQQLASGPLPARRLLQVATAMGIAERTLYRAKDALGITTARAGGYGATGQWTWSPPLDGKLWTSKASIS